MNHENNKKDNFVGRNNSSHLDDIDKFFYENFVNLIDSSNESQNISNNLQKLESKDEKSQTLNTNDKNTDIEILNFDI